MTDRHGPPIIDLDPSEWSRDKPLEQPFFTPQGRVFLRMLAILLPLGVVISIPISLLVKGHAPYWAKSFIPFEWEGAPNVVLIGGTLIFIVLPLAYEAIRWFLRRLRG